MSDDRLARIFETSDDAQLTERYDAWATDYDADHAAWGWIGPVRATERLLALGEPGRILDAGCGTGGVGTSLRAAGWRGDLSGVDLSGAMLARADAGGWYDQLTVGTLTDLPMRATSVDAYVATGVYTHGHVGAEGFSEALRVVRPGGWIALTVRMEVWEVLRGEAERLETAGRWRLVERSEPTSFHPGKGDQDDKPQSVVVWRRT